METGLLEKKISELPDNLKIKVADDVDELLAEVKKEAEEKDGFIIKRGFGSLKGKIWMSDDFDEPLEDFKEYM